MDIIRAKLQKAHDEAVKRLEGMHEKVSRSRNLRKRKMQEYTEEVRELVTHAKKRMQEEIKKKMVIAGA